MDTQIRPIGGSAYRTKETLDNVFVDKQTRDLVVGQRDISKRSRASILIGKVIERALASDYFDYNLWLDAEFPHVTFIAGKRGSGKSYDLGIILEGLGALEGANFSKQPPGFCTILFDIQSQFWTLGKELRPDLPSDEDQLSAIQKWNLVGKVTQPQLYLPSGCAPVTGTEEKLTIPPRSMELADWFSLLECSRFEPVGQLLSTCLQIVSPNKPDFEISDIVQELSQALHPDIQMFQGATRDALQWRLQALISTGLFGAGQLPTASMLTPGRSSIVLMRELSEDLKAVVVAVLMRHIERAMSRHHQTRKTALRTGATVSEGMPNRVWVLIDEAHLVCPGVGETAANSVIVDYVKRGRDAGLSLVLATQQPSAIDSAAISQVDLTILHKLTVDADIQAATARLPAPMPNSVRVRDKDVSDPKALVRELLPGEALLSDAEASRTFLVRLRPRICPHGGGEPLL